MGAKQVRKHLTILPPMVGGDVLKVQCCWVQRVVVWLHVKHSVHQEVARGEKHCARGVVTKRYQFLVMFFVVAFLASNETKTSQNWQNNNGGSNENLQHGTLHTYM